MTNPSLALVVAVVTVVRCAWRPPPPPPTIDQLRSRLAHDPASRFGLLGGLVASWHDGGYRPSDAAEVTAVIADLREIHRAALALSAQRWILLWRQVEIERALVVLEGTVAAIERRGVPATGDIERVRDWLEILQVRSTALVAGLTRAIAVSLAEVIARAVDEIEDEARDRVAGEVEVEVARTPTECRIWLDAVDGDRWRDLFGNLLRNAIQATREAPFQAERQRPPVRVVLTPRPPGGCRLEVLDQGIGMTERQRADLWVDGGGRHGRGRGHGLTESKRRFAMARADVAITSEPGRGTEVVLDFPSRDVVVRVPPTWRRATVRAAMAFVSLCAIIGLMAAAWSGSLEASPSARNVEVFAPSTLRGLGRDGRILWERDLGSPLLPNRPRGGGRSDETLAVHREPGTGLIREFVAATAAGDFTAGELIFATGRGEVVARRALAWSNGRDPNSPARLVSYCQVALDVPGADPPIYLVEARSDRGAMVSMRLESRDGVEAAYRHPGHLKYETCRDFDGDGRADVLLYGINNHACADSLLADWPPRTWYGCAALLDLAAWDGQAFPYRAWEGLAHARELAYLLIEPLGGDEDVLAQVWSTDVQIGESGNLEIVLHLEDGRDLTTDALLRPQRIDVGQNTPAYTLAREGRRRSWRVARLVDGELAQFVLELPGGEAR